VSGCCETATDAVVTFVGAAVGALPVDEAGGEAVFSPPQAIINKDASASRLRAARIAVRVS